MVERFMRENFEMRPYAEGLWVRYSDYAALEAENARLTKERDEATAYMRNLLLSFVGEHFPDNDGWKPLGDLVGMLTQIDNASTIAREYKARIAALEAQLAEQKSVVAGLNIALGQAWQSNREREATIAGLQARLAEGRTVADAIAFVQRRLDDYVSEVGTTDFDTGTVEFPDDGEYAGELEEIIEGLSALEATPPAQKFEHNATNDHIAAVMLQHGSDAQKREALACAGIATPPAQVTELEKAKREAIDALIKADDVWDDYGSGFRVHFSFNPGSNQMGVVERIYTARALTAAQEADKP